MGDIMKYLVIGHPLERPALFLTPGMPHHFALPRGTTLWIMTDHGLGLDLRQGIWHQLAEDYLPCFEGDVLPNFWRVTWAADLGDASLLDHPDFEGFTILRPGIDGPDPLALCGGDPACPTTDRAVEAGVRHTCDGVLGRAEGATVHWVGCGPVRSHAAELAPLAEAGLAAVADAANATTLECTVSGSLLVVGEHREQLHASPAARAHGCVDFRLTVHRKQTSSGTDWFAVEGVPLTQWHVVESALAVFPSHTVVFR